MLMTMDMDEDNESNNIYNIESRYVLNSFPVCRIKNF